MGWPRAAVYDPSGTHWYLRWFAPLLVGLVLAVGALLYRLRGRVPARSAQAPASTAAA
jgi:hypothetical protein